MIINISTQFYKFLRLALSCCLFSAVIGLTQFGAYDRDWSFSWIAGLLKEVFVTGRHGGSKLYYLKILNTFTCLRAMNLTAEKHPAPTNPPASHSQLQVYMRGSEIVCLCSRQRNLLKIPPCSRDLSSWSSNIFPVIDSKNLSGRPFKKLATSINLTSGNPLFVSRSLHFCRALLPSPLPNWCLTWDYRGHGPASFLNQWFVFSAHD